MLYAMLLNVCGGITMVYGVGQFSSSGAFLYLQLSKKILLRLFFFSKWKEIVGDGKPKVCCP